MARKMSSEQREKFLAQPHLGVLCIAAETGRAPMATPIWYDYRPGGDVKVFTPPRSRKARLIAEAGRFSLCVQEAEGLRYVSVEGPVVETVPSTEDERNEIARRYVEPERVAAFLEATYETHATNVAISMRPERWNAIDFSDVAAQIAEHVPTRT
ncbi:pyridoxamine 5'-phosphate oxidase family protein [Streptomyces sp. NPDC006012]|uniref:pyridoxamine 5'-phosphate oxidase family protein n=1 Tax=Streptomyces sp. NPDC006012 TaxID=3364739 RepID=UPI0036C2ACCB